MNRSVTQALPLIACVWAGPALAEVSLDQQKQFGTIAGGWWLNERCTFLDEPARTEFSWHVEQITRFLSAEIGNDMVVIWVNAAKATADEVPCGGSANDIVDQTTVLARDLNFSLTGQEYVAGSSDLTSLAERLGGIAMMVGVEERCEFGPPEGRAMFIKLYERSAAAASLKYNTDLATGLAAMREFFRGNASPECNPETERDVMQQVNSAKNLAHDLGVWSPETGFVE